MTLVEFKKEINKQIEMYPSLTEEILDFYELAITEIEDGASASNEISLCLDSIEELKQESKLPPHKPQILN